MYEVLDAVNRGQSQLAPSNFRPAFPASHLSHAVGTRGDGPSSERIKRDSGGEGVGPNNTFSSSQTGSRSLTARHPAPNRDHDRNERGRERERDPREWKGSERGREPAGGVGGDRKRSLGYYDGREREDRDSYDRDRRERKRSVYFSLSFPTDPVVSSFVPRFLSISPPVIFPPWSTEVIGL